MEEEDRLDHMLVLTCGQAEIEVERRKRAPVGHVVPRDVPIVGYHYWAVDAWVEVVYRRGEAPNSKKGP